MRAAVVGMMLVALVAFASDRSFGQQQPRRGLDNLLDDNQGITGPAQAVVPATNQLDVPAEAELKDADKQIKTAYEADYKGDPKLLAEKLNAAACEIKEEDDPASKYVLLLESQEAFRRAGDVDNAVQLLNARGVLFKINMPVEKLKLIKEFPKPVGAVGKKLIDLSLKMTGEALEADQVEIAEDAIDLALALARKSAGPDRLKTCAQEKARVKERRVASDECQTALAALKKNLADQEANSVVGRYYSIDKHDWEKGLPYLIKGEPDSLQDYATREQALRKNEVPADNTTEQMFLLAGDWWTLSEDPKVKDKKLAAGIKTHASDLYAELLPNLTHPVDKKLAKTRGADGRNMGGNKPDKRRPKLGAIENSIGMEFIEIPKGNFLMGDGGGAVGVILTKPFLLGKYEVTQGQFKKVMETEPWLNKGEVQIGEDNAASFVDWNDATVFCRRLTDTDHKDGKLPTGDSYRLPTEAEWEYACRAGTTTAFSFGDESKLNSHAWWGAFDIAASLKGEIKAGPGTAAREQYAHEVGLKKPNPAGLFDMHGNVWEWCSDWHRSGLSGGQDPAGPGGGSERVNHGGSWGSPPDHCRSALRSHYVPSSRNSHLGFRVARSQSAQ